MVVGKVFGTDGIRGIDGECYWISSEGIRHVLKALVVALNLKPGYKVLVGVDTRSSAVVLERFIVDYCLSLGMQVTRLSFVPTFCLAMYLKAHHYDLGIMVSASHNKAEYSGVKFFDSRGRKFSKKLEMTIENLLNNLPVLNETVHSVRSSVNIVEAYCLPQEELERFYLDCLRSFSGYDLYCKGYKIVVDTAHGSGYAMIPNILRHLGFDVIVVGAQPDGKNINLTGVMSAGLLREKVLESGAFLGIAFDGDADRLLVCDEHAKLYDGNFILGCLFNFYRSIGSLLGGVVGTILSNSALEQFVEGHKFKFYRASVGDQSVLSAMHRLSFSLGGEPSGHIIACSKGPTMDGLLVFLELFRAFLESKKLRFSDFIHVFDVFPEEKANFYAGVDPRYLLGDFCVQEAIRDVSDRLGKQGRLVVRPSGTESVIRILIETKSEIRKDYLIYLLSILSERASKLGESASCCAATAFSMF